MAKEQAIESEGVIVKAEKGRFKVQLVDEEGTHLENMKPVICHLGGKMRKHYIKVVQGDRVKIEITPYDLTRGRITYRYK